MSDFFKFYVAHIRCKDGTKLMQIKELFGMPLYAWYVVEIDEFQTGDIDGTLMTPPFEFHGPFADLAESDKVMQSLYEAHT